LYAIPYDYAQDRPWFLDSLRALTGPAIPAGTTLPLGFAPWLKILTNQDNKWVSMFDRVRPSLLGFIAFSPTALHPCRYPACERTKVPLFAVR
ncbi:MAG: hypothetical protein WAW61_07545, partial [Methylococcaceae bacterium]